MTGIPKDAREVYCNEKGEPIAYCHKEGYGLTDIEREFFFSQNEDRLRQLAIRARQKTIEENELQCVVCIDVDDPTWTPLVELLMPGSEAVWDSFRAKGEKPIARGVVPQDMIEEIVKEFYPAAGDFTNYGDYTTYLVVFAAGGAKLILDEAKV